MINTAFAHHSHWCGHADVLDLHLSGDRELDLLLLQRGLQAVMGQRQIVPLSRVARFHSQLVEKGGATVGGCQACISNRTVRIRREGRTVRGLNVTLAPGETRLIDRRLVAQNFHVSAPCRLEWDSATMRVAAEGVEMRRVDSDLIAFERNINVRMRPVDSCAVRAIF
mmetsp:Transcript_15351/g.38795  ORF Transcript_15351/g.38795 Transcript_15351/m.38795 type:complete len:168 (-) Transcript_15351:185-688(-)